MQNRVTYILFLLICAVTAVLSMPSSRGSSRDGVNAADSSSALAALFGGQQTRPRPTEKSLFDSDFWKTGVSDKGIPDEPGRPGRRDGEPELLEPTSAGNPINPETNQPYSDAVMEQFSELRKMFPGNSIIPRRKAPEDVKAEEQERVSVYALQTKIFQNQASSDEIDKFYDFQSKGIKDRLELLQYVIKEQGPQMSADIKAKYEQILQMNTNQLQSFDEARKRAHATSGR